MIRQIRKPGVGNENPSDSGQEPPGEYFDSGDAARPGRSAERKAIIQELGDPLPGPTDPRQVSAYILDLTVPLRNLASNAGLDFLAYLLDMVAEEAEGLSRNAGVTGTTRAVTRHGTG